jgi:hypothetical protein
MVAEIVRLIEAAERTLETERRTTVPLTIIRRKAAWNQAREMKVAQTSQNQKPRLRDFSNSLI